MRAIARRVSARLGSAPAAAPVPGPHPLARRVRRLERRMGELERELRVRLAEVEEGLQEQRALSQRVAVLGDLVAEVVSAAARGDREDLDAALTRYSDGL